ncbi:MAG TPA: acetate--CoA ligase family protein [Candidatus Dormibacteraeota bacterium]
MGTRPLRRRRPQPPRHRPHRPPLSGWDISQLKRDLRPLFDPRSLAILGASKDPAKWGYALSKNALKGRSRRRVFLVNRNGDEILGERSYSSLRDLPESPELVVITIRPAGFATAVDEALAVGARAIVAITAGLGERDSAGRAIQDEAVRRCKQAGAVMVGPNCLGITDLTTDLDLTWDDFGRGSVALVSQSGNVGLELAQHAHYFGVGFSRFVSLGNQADLDASECVEDLINHDDTRVIAVYLEDFGDGRQFATVAARAVAAGKPVILLTVGSTSASRRMAYSHTGALVSDSLAIDAACRAAGIFRVHTPMQLIDLAQLLLMPRQPGGPRMSVIGDGGGHVALAADRLAAYGLQVEPFTEKTAGEIANVLPPTAASANPVDVAGGGEEDIWTFQRAVRLMAESGEADVVILTGYFGGYSEQLEPYAKQELEVANKMADDAEATRCPLIVQTMYPRSATSQTFRERGVPVFADIEAPARALGLIVDRLMNPPSFEIPTAQPAAGGSGRGADPMEIPSTHAVGRGSGWGADPMEIPSPHAVGGGSGWGVDYFSIRRLLTDAGIHFAEARPVSSEGEAIDAARELGYPIVLKALGTVHKSDVGGVRLAIANEAGLRSAFKELESRLHPSVLSVEANAPLELGVELLIGVKRDRSFGPIVLVGLGGLYTEVFRDVAVALGPVSRDQAGRLIRSLHGSELVTGSRGRPPLDIDAAALAVERLAAFAIAAPSISEVEINPLLVLPQDAIALDARAVGVQQ